MVLEATMICIDNSEWMRNGDYSPNRFQSLSDAVNLICGAKTQSNPENTVGLLTMAGKGVRVLVTPTSDLGKILACMHGLEIGGEMDLAAGIQVAQLALKHRQNKKQQQRIIVFAGSPVKYEKKTLEMIGRKLKKNSVALDVVDFGEDEEGKSEKLEALVAAVNNNETSHYVHVPPGSSALSDVLISTPIFTGDGEGGSGFAAAAAAAAAGGVSGFDFGVDPNLDPELALALRVSMEEERARQEAAAKKAAEEASGQEKGESSSQDVTMGESSSANAEADKKIDIMDDENALLQQALAMSMDEPASTTIVRDIDMSDAAVDDQDLQLALQLSVEDGDKESSSQPDQTDVSKLLSDQSFVSSILASLPGVDPNDPSVKDLLASMQNQSEMSDSHETDKNIEIWKLKKLIKGLKAARGNGTSMISLIIPPRDQVSRVTKMLDDEYGTASKVNNRSVLAAITSAQQRLKLYNKVPPNGLVLYTGTIVTDDGKEKKVTTDFEPFKPINASLYLCDKKFHTEALNELLESDKKFGFIIMDGNGALFGTLSGNTREVLRKFTVDLPKQHGRGGQPDLRFACLCNVMKRDDYLWRAAKLATQFYINPATSQPIVSGLILAGSGDFKTQLICSRMFPPCLLGKVVRVVEVSYGGEPGFNEAIDLSADILANVKFIQEMKLIGKYFKEICHDTGKYVFGVEDTLKALEMGAVEILIVWENLDINRYTLKNVSTGEIVIKHLNKDQESDKSNFRDPDTRPGKRVNRVGSGSGHFGSGYFGFD